METSIVAANSGSDTSSGIPQGRPESQLPIPVRLRNLKDAVPATWRELSSLFEVHEKTLLRWARGETDPSFENVRRLRQLEDGLRLLDQPTRETIPTELKKETT